MATNNTYSQQEKLKSRKALEGLFAKGQSFSVFPIKVFYTVTNLSAEDNLTLDPKASLVHAGVGVSARIFKKAHDRNKVKRLLREVYRTQKQPLYQVVAANQRTINVFFLYIGKTLPVFADLQINMAKTLQKLVKKLSEPHQDVQSV
jgi:ribonuclease P protein component